jgi:Fic family protein
MLNIYPEPRLLARIEAKKAELARYQPLKPSTLKLIQENFRILLTYHSNAIEGSTLTLRETQMAIEEGFALGNKKVVAYLEAINHAHAVDYLESLDLAQTVLSLELIKKLHQLIMKNSLEDAGEFRRVAVYIRGVNKITPPAPLLVEPKLQDWLEKYSAPTSIHPLTLAATAHHDFEVIHPFRDGNGRVGRLILNFMLKKSGYPSALIEENRRALYIIALDSANSGNFTPLLNIVAMGVERSLDLYLEAVQENEPDSYQSLPELAKLTGIKTDYLGALIRKGKIEGVKRGGRWFSKLSAINHYRREVDEGIFGRGRPSKQTLS